MDLFPHRLKHRKDVTEHSFGFTMEISDGCLHPPWTRDFNQTISFDERLKNFSVQRMLGPIIQQSNSLGYIVDPFRLRFSGSIPWKNPKAWQFFP